MISFEKPTFTDYDEVKFNRLYTHTHTHRFIVRVPNS